MCILQEYLDYGVKAFHFLSLVQVLSSRSSGLREDGKVANRDTAAGDPPGLRDQVSISAMNHLSVGILNCCMFFDVPNLECTGY